MKIKDIVPMPISVPLKLTEPAPLWSDGWSNQLLLLVKSERGLTGIGEAFVNTQIQAPYVELAKLIGEYIIGFNPMDINSIHEFLEKISYPIGRGGVVSAIISAIDVSLHDLVAKALGIPLYEFLGGKKRDKIPVYASLPRYKSCEEVCKVVDRVLENKFSALKLHQPARHILECAKKIREFGYDFKLMIDLNCGLNIVNAINLIKKLEKYEIEWVEEPIWPPENYRLLGELARKTEIPIAAGENEYTLYGFMKLITEGMVSFIQPDIAKVGGLTQIKKIAALAEAYGVTLMPHSRPQSLWITILTTAHFLSSLPQESMIEVSPLPPYQDPFIKPIKVINGYLVIPDGLVGIGVKTEKWFALFPPKRSRIPRFADLDSWFN